MLDANTEEQGPMYLSHQKLRYRLRLTDRVHLTETCQ